jgi:hypothetical protein
VEIRLWGQLAYPGIYQMVEDDRKDPSNPDKRYTYVYICMYTYVNMYLYIHIHEYVYIYIYTEVYIYKHTYVYMYIYTHIYIYIYIYRVCILDGRDSDGSLRVKWKW